MLSGLAARVRIGHFGRGKRVQTATVSGALTAIGQTIALAVGTNPIKIEGTGHLLPRLQQMLDGWRKEDPATVKMLPVEADVPELLVTQGQQKGTTELEKAVGDLVMIAFYYLLRVGEYTVKGKRNDTKQTVQFKMEDVTTFFKKNTHGVLRCLHREASDQLVMQADGATLKLDNQKNGWKGVCIYQEGNGQALLCPVRALGRRICHLRRHGARPKTFLSAYFAAGTQGNVTAEHVSAAVKIAATALSYPGTKGIPIQRINTHSLRSGGANALALAGYSDTQIQKMGRWRGATFKEYIREELACYSQGMSRSMQRQFGFVNIAGNAFHEIPMDDVDMGDWGES